MYTEGTLRLKSNAVKLSYKLSSSLTNLCHEQKEKLSGKLWRCLAVILCWGLWLLWDGQQDEAGITQRIVGIMGSERRQGIASYPIWTSLRMTSPGKQVRAGKNKIEGDFFKFLPLGGKTPQVWAI